MRFKSVTIENCKSYSAEETVFFDPVFTILIGPNGGGKSNTLDALNIALRSQLLWSYNLNHGADRGVTWTDISRQELFGHITEYLDPNHDRPDDDVTVQLEIEVRDGDVANLTAVRDKRSALERALKGCPVVT